MKTSVKSFFLLAFMMLISIQNASASILPDSIAADMGAVRADQIVVGGLVIACAIAAFGIRWVKATFF